MEMNAHNVQNEIIVPGWNFFIEKFAKTFVEKIGSSIGGGPDIRPHIKVLLDNHPAFVQSIREGVLSIQDDCTGQTAGDYVADHKYLKEIFSVIAPVITDPCPIIFSRDELQNRCRKKEQRVHDGKNRGTWEEQKRFSERGKVAYAIFGHNIGAPLGTGNLDKNWKGFEFCLFVQILAYMNASRSLFQKAANRSYFEGGERNDLVAHAEQYGFFKDAAALLPDLGLLLTEAKLERSVLTKFESEVMPDNKLLLKWEDRPHGYSVILDRRFSSSKDKWSVLVDRKKRDDFEDDCQKYNGEKMVYRVRTVYENTVEEEGLCLEVWVPDEPRVEKGEWEGNQITLQWTRGKNSCKTVILRGVDRSPQYDSKKRPEASIDFVRRTEETTYVENSIQPGRTYYYLLIAEYDGGMRSAGQALKIRIPKPPPPPKSVQARYEFDEKTGGNRVYITASPGSDTEGVLYRVLRYTCGREGEDHSTKKCIEQISADLSWVDQTAEPGWRYVYHVIPLRKNIPGQLAKSNMVDITSGIWDITCEAFTGTVEFRYQSHEIVKEVWFSRGERGHETKDGIKVIASKGLARDSGLENNKRYYYQIACRYEFADGSMVWSKLQIRDAKPQVKPEAVDLNARPDGERVICGLGDPRIGRLVVVRLSQRPLCQRGSRILISEVPSQDGLQIPVTGRMAIDEKPNPNEPYYIVFTICDDGGYALVGDCRKCAMVQDVRELRWFYVVGGVRLTWKWPEHCNKVLVLKANGKEPGMPTCERKGNAIFWSCPDGEVTTVIRDNYEEDGDSYFLGIALESGSWHVRVLAVVGDTTASGEQPGCRCIIGSGGRVRLDYGIRIRGHKLIFRWRVNPDVKVDFVLVGREGEPPERISTGRILYASSSEENWPRPTAKGLRCVEIPWPYNGNGYCRVFADEVHHQESQVAIRHPEGILSAVDIQESSFIKPKSTLPTHPRQVLCPYCFERFNWWQLLFHEDGKPCEMSIVWWKKVLAIIHAYQAAPESLLISHFEMKKVCPKWCKTESREKSHQPAVDLDNALFRHPSLHMGLLGTMKAGKSHWIFGAIRRLEAAGLGPIGHTQKELMTMRDRVIGNKTPLIGTLPPPSDAIIPPLLFHAKGTYKKAVIGFCDVDGERWGIFGEPGKMRYLRTSQSFVYIIDPLQMDGVRSMLGSAMPEDAPKDKECMSQLGPLDNLLNVLRKRQPGEKYQIPIAVVVSKGDVIRDHEHSLRKSLWEQPLYHQHHGTLSYDLSLHWNVQFAVREFLMKHEPGPGIVANIENNFQHFAYFCVAPTGCSARNNRFARFAPWRVEEPVLWIFAKLGLIPVV